MEGAAIIYEDDINKQKANVSFCEAHDNHHHPHHRITLNVGHESCLLAGEGSLGLTVAEGREGRVCIGDDQTRIGPGATHIVFPVFWNIFDAGSTSYMGGRGYGCR